MATRTASQERRAAMRLLVVAAVVLAGMLAMWWLVESTNKEGEHDAQLLPFLTLIPLCFALVHLFRARLAARR
jgi:apolipoprotein N-acyltransferase